MSEPVTADRPDSSFQTSGLDHVTIWGSNEAATVEFYRDLLGMPLVLRQPNLDDPSQTHLFFDAGDGRIITFFVSDERDSRDRPQQPGVGGVHHLAFSFAPDQLAEVKAGLEEAGHRYSVFDRGIFYSLYTRDHDGLVIELTTDKFDIPDDRRAEVLAKAQEIREADGAEYAKDDHLRAALEALDIEVIEHSLPDADTGSGV